MSRVCLRAPRFLLVVSALAFVATSPLLALDTFTELRFEHRSNPPAVFGSGGAGELVLDDGTAEGVFGVGVTAARQFLWFNQFPVPVGGAQLDEIQVLFPSGDNMVVGDPVEIVVYLDTDNDPTNGADLLTSFVIPIEALDTAFSRYPVDPPVVVGGGSDLLIGVINRFTDSGVDTPTSPAALDITASQGRSWLATWTGDPLDPPALPSDDLTLLVDDFEPGNWMIRGVTSRLPVQAIPALGRLELAVFAALLALLGAAMAARMRRAGS